MPSRHIRLCRLEARCPPVVIDPAPWDAPPQSYFDQVIRILWATGCFTREALAHTVAGSTAPDVVAALTCLLQEPPADGD